MAEPNQDQNPNPQPQNLQQQQPQGQNPPQSQQGGSHSMDTRDPRLLQQQQRDQGQGRGQDRDDPHRIPAPLPPHPDLTREPARPGEARVNPIWVNPDDWNRTQNEIRSLQDFKRNVDKELEMREAERIKTLAEKGQVEEALSTLRAGYEKKFTEMSTRAQDVESKWLEERRNAAINDTLAGRQFTGADPKATAAILRRVLEQEIEAVRDANGNPVIRDRLTLRPAAEYLQERLNSPDLAVFFAPFNPRGGAGTDGARPAAASPKSPEDPNMAFAAAFMKKKEEARNARF